MSEKPHTSEASWLGCDRPTLFLLIILCAFVMAFVTGMNAFGPAWLERLAAHEPQRRQQVENSLLRQAKSALRAAPQPVNEPKGMGVK